MATVSNDDAPRLARRLDKFGAMTVWQEFTPLARETGAVNLGQGFPDWPSPDFVKDAIVRAVREDHNQYARSAGQPDLCKEIAARYSPLLGRELNWETEITIGVGSSECLFACMQALVNDGDEVLMISPAFDIYSAQVSMAGGTGVYVPLRIVKSDDGASRWTLDMAELRAALTPRTRVLLINTPQNPTGAMFTREELNAIASILRDFPRVVVVSDEVYENMFYPGHEHVRMATVDDMWQRTLTVSSAGKTFSITGWKIGWVIGPAALVAGVITTNQWVQFSVCTPAQQAVAYAFRTAAAPYQGHASYYHWLRAQYERKRDILLRALAASGLAPIAPDGGFFIIADSSAVAVPDRFMRRSSPACGPVMTRDWACARFLTEEIGVGCIPPSAFYEEKDKHLAANIVRFAFCKEDASLFEAARRLQKLRGYLVDPTLASRLPPPPEEPPASA